MKKYVLLLIFVTHLVSAKQLFYSSEMVNNKDLKNTEISAMLVQVNNELLLDGSKQFDIQLPNGINATAVFEKLKYHAKNRYSWYGHLKGQPQEQIIISVVNGFYAGSIYTKAAVFELSSSNKNQMRISVLATEAFPDCEGGVEVESSGVSNEIDQVLDYSNSGGTVKIDVMVVYSPQARDGAGGVAAIEDTAQAAVDAMNLSFANSNVDAEATLSYTGLVDYDEANSPESPLSWVRGNGTVAGLRNTYGADMVSLIVNDLSGCGTGYVMRNPGSGFAGSAFQVTKRSCAVGNLSFAHEFGHNMGLEHNPENASVDPGDASNPWSFGHYHSGSYRTVMSYFSPCANFCSRRQYYSNPDVQFNGLDTGVENSRDNARTLDQTVSIIAAFRPPAVDVIFEDGFD